MYDCHKHAQLYMALQTEPFPGKYECGNFFRCSTVVVCWHSYMHMYVSAPPKLLIGVPAKSLNHVHASIVGERFCAERSSSESQVTSCVRVRCLHGLGLGHRVFTGGCREWSRLKKLP